MRFSNFLWMAALTATPLSAADKPAHSRAPAFQRLVDCRSVKDSAERLACFDREVAALDTAERTSEIVVVDKEQVRKTKRGLFGLSLPNIKLFGDNDNSEEVAQIESRIASASEGVDGWTIRLEDGTVWRQTGTDPFYRTPKAGLAAIVKRGALGSFVIRVGGSPGVKVKRIQ